jgi:hypothetical protein
MDETFLVTIRVGAFVQLCMPIHLLSKQGLLFSWFSAMTRFSGHSSG